MTAGKEAAFEMALASNALMVLHSMIHTAMVSLYKLQTELSMVTDPNANMIAQTLIKSDDILKSILARYDQELGKVTDETPDVKDEVLAELKGHDLINAVELILRMSAQDKMAQLKMRGL